VPKERRNVPDRKFRLSALELLLLAVIVIGLAFMVRALVAPEMVSDSHLSATVSQLEQRMAEIAGRLNLAETASGTSKEFYEEKNGTEPGRPLTERMNLLEQRVEELERRLELKGGGTKNDEVALIRDAPRKTAISE